VYAWHIDSRRYTSDFTQSPITFKCFYHRGTKALSRRRRNRCQVSVAGKWQLALRRRLLQIACQPDAAWGVQIFGSHWGGGRDRTAGSSVYRHYYYYYYYLLQLGFHPVAVVLTVVHTIQMFSPGGSSPYTSTHNTNGHIINIKVTIQNKLYTITNKIHTVNTSTQIRTPYTHYILSPNNYLPRPKSFNHYH
jgi:hypothetical protein